MTSGRGSEKEAKVTPMARVRVVVPTYDRAALLVGNSQIGAIGFAPPRVNAIEAASNYSLTVRRYGPATEAASIAYSTADGTALAGEKLRRVLTNDPGMGIIRHVDAGYDRADEVADERGVSIPMRTAE